MSSCASASPPTATTSRRSPKRRGESAAAEAYDHHVGPYRAKLAAELIGVAGIRPGQRALDVGCGPGPLAQPLADLLGPKNVAGIDPSEPFAEACRTRVPGAGVRVGVGEPSCS